MDSVVDVSVTEDGTPVGAVQGEHVMDPVLQDAAVHVSVVVSPQYPVRQLQVLVVAGTLTAVHVPPATVGVPHALQSGVAGQQPVVAHVMS